MVLKSSHVPGGGEVLKKSRQNRHEHLACHCPERVFVFEGQETGFTDFLQQLAG